MAGELPEGEEVCSPDALAARVRVHSGEQRRRHRPARRRARGARVLASTLMRTAAAAAATQGVDGLVGAVGELSSRSREVIISSSEIGCEIGEVVEGHLIRFRFRVRVRARARVQEIRRLGLTHTAQSHPAPNPDP